MQEEKKHHHPWAQLLKSGQITYKGDWTQGTKLNFTRGFEKQVLACDSDWV
jgi:hypothetical protein